MRTPVSSERMEQKQLKPHKEKANSPFSALKRQYRQLKNRCEFDDLLVLAVVFVVSGYLAVVAIMQ